MSVHWLDEFPIPVGFLVSISGSLVHLYWGGLALTGIFTGREIYHSAIGLGYFWDLVFWRILYVFVETIVWGHVYGDPPTSFAWILSHDLTREIYLSGVLAGVIAFHMAYYETSMQSFSSKPWLLIMLVITPSAMAIVGTIAHKQTAFVYTFYWIMGLVTGMIRSYIIAHLVSLRLPVISAAASGTDWFSVRDTIIIGTPWAVKTYKEQGLLYLMWGAHHREIVFGSL